MRQQQRRKRTLTFQRFLKKVQDFLDVRHHSRLLETTFYVYRTDTNAVLARNVDGFDAAKDKANQLRKQLGLKWDQVKFKAQRTTPSATSSRGTGAGSGRIEYAPRFNRSKGRYFRGYTDADDNYHDID